MIYHFISYLWLLSKEAFVNQFFFLTKWNVKIKIRVFIHLVLKKIPIEIFTLLTLIFAEHLLRTPEVLSVYVYKHS